MTEQKSKLIVVLILIIATIAIYWQIQNYEFIRFDEELYLTKNINIQQGLSLENIRWSFATIDAGYFQPLTWLSLMLDYELFKLNAGGYHWTNLLLHIISTVLLFLVLNKMTDSLWRSGFVASLFALHPLYVESVVWIAERKDVLSCVFWMLTMHAYLAYVRQSNIWRYSLMLLVFVLGLMAKPMLVTLPFVLLLLDYWPLNRFTFELKQEGENKRRKLIVVPIGEGNTISHLILEKIPFIVLTLIFSSITFYTAQKVSAIASVSNLSIFSRISNSLVSYVEYISKMSDGNFWNFWYSADWAQINMQQALANEVISGSASSLNPLYYNQQGIDRLQNRVVQVANQGVTAGLGNGQVLVTKLSQSQFLANFNAGNYAGKIVVNAEPMQAYANENPNDYGVGKYAGISCVWIPQLPFLNIYFNLQATTLLVG